MKSQNLEHAMPDPFWPEGVEPRHLSPEERRDETVAAAWEEKLAPVHNIWHCTKCGSTEGPSVKDDKYCNKCYDLEVQNSALARKTNDSWMEQSAELGLAIYERQPEETNLEWLIWETYRSYYPMKLPTWSELAKKVNCSVAAVTRAAARWSYRARLVAWARFTDDGIQEQRIAAVKEMNQKQLSMAQTIQDKLRLAIDGLDPDLLKPNEIVNLFKVATELERRVTTYVDEKVESTAAEAKVLNKPKTKADDLNEVVSILQSAGMLQASSNKVVGVEQKTTILVKEE